MGITTLTQESLVSLLLWDAENGGRVCTLVPITAWDGVYKRIATKAIDYWAEFREPPGEHAIDMFASLEEDDPKQKDQVRRLWESLNESREGINAKYVLGQVSTFLREQRIRVGIIESVELLESGNLAEAEATIQRSVSGVLDVFDPGLLFHELDVSSLLTDDRVALPTGIKLLDQRGLGPTAGELCLFIAPPGYGKSWWLIHLAKLAVANRKRVVYVTLEMSERRVAQRFLQSFCGVAKRREELVNRTFEENELGQLIGINTRPIKRLKTFQDADIEAKLTQQLKGFARRSPLVIKQFPTGVLTVRELQGYLDSLEMSRRIVPDLLLVDYADLMSIGTRDYRHELGNLYKDLRGLAVSRNIALATASQSNRDSIGEKIITGRNVAEDFSKIATSDIVLTYNRTEAEFKLGTARLFVEKGRNDEDKFLILLSQNYKTGQFCLSSTRMMPRKYWEAVKAGDDNNGLPRRRNRL